MHITYVGLGSNLKNPYQQLQDAIHALDCMPDSRLVAVSSLYASRPMGPQDQPDYVNAVAKIETDLDPHQLLDSLQHIEQQHGRERKAQRWGPRTLDLDILLYADQVIEDERLTVPHYGLADREFVVYPLAEIAADLILPDGRTLQSIKQSCERNGLQKIHHEGTPHE